MVGSSCRLGRVARLDRPFAPAPLSLVGAIGCGGSSVHSSSPRVAVDAPRYPRTPRTEANETRFGSRAEDPYRWLEPTDDASVRAWSVVQDELARGILSRLPLRELFRRSLRRAVDRIKGARRACDGATARATSCHRATVRTEEPTASENSCCVIPSFPRAWIKSTCADDEAMRRMTFHRGSRAILGLAGGAGREAWFEPGSRFTCEHNAANRPRHASRPAHKLPIVPPDPPRSGRWDSTRSKFGQVTARLADDWPCDRPRGPRRTRISRNHLPRKARLARGAGPIGRW
jgi:hypothetical protein